MNKVIARIPPILPPQRILSLCPSVTETLFDLGLADRIVGRTRFCIHPKAEIKQIPSVGGTKEVKYERIRELQPDCILAVKEENTLEIVETLAKEFPVFVLDVENRAEALQMITDIGEITHTQVESQALRQQIQSKWASIANIVSAKRSLYFIWKNPYMLAGKDTFIQDVMAHIGLHNLALPLAGRYPEISIPHIQALHPELILLSSEPYPFQQQHIAELQQIVPNAKIVIVDGEMFSWYGSRMLLAADYFQALAISTHFL